MQLTSVRSIALLIVLLFTLCACNRETGSRPDVTAISGEYSLIRYSGQQLPADLGEIIPPGPNPSEPSGCHFLVTGGSLNVNMNTKTFRYFYELKELCENQLLSVNETYGDVEVIDDRTLRFITSVDDPADYRRVAILEGDLITVQEFSGEGQIDLVFERPD